MKLDKSEDLRDSRGRRLEPSRQPIPWSMRTMIYAMIGVTGVAAEEATLGVLAGAIVMMAESF